VLQPLLGSASSAGCIWCFLNVQSRAPAAAAAAAAAAVHSRIRTGHMNAAEAPPDKVGRQHFASGAQGARAVRSRAGVEAQQHLQWVPRRALLQPRLPACRVEAAQARVQGAGGSKSRCGRRLMSCVRGRAGVESEGFDLTASVQCVSVGLAGWRWLAGRSCTVTLGWNVVRTAD
jgi:hypothetical protein